MDNQLKTLEFRIKELEKKLDVVLNLLVSEYYDDDAGEAPTFEIGELDAGLVKLN